LAYTDYLTIKEEKIMLYNNGYIVKDLIDNEDLLISHSIYKGLQSYHNWPLEKEGDLISKELTKAVQNFFDENGYIEIMRDTKLLRRYVSHCKKLKINVIIIKIMSSKYTFISDEDLEEMEVLGYDCMAGDSVSYLTEIHTEGGDRVESYKRIKDKLNTNGLLSTYEEVEDFIKERNKLLEQGVNLEDYWESVPVRLSLVAI
jgi:hypothetical protein